MSPTATADRAAPTDQLDVIAANYSVRSDLQGELRSLDEKLTTDVRPPTEAEVELIKEIRGKLEAVDARILANLEMAQEERTVRNGIEGLIGASLDEKASGKLVDTRSIGERMADAEGLAEYRARPTGDFHVDLPDYEMRAVVTGTTGPASAGALVVPERSDRMGQDILDRKVYLSDLIPTVSVGGPWEYVQDQTPLADFYNLITEIAEGTAKPQVGVTLDLVQENMATIAAWTQFTRQAEWDANTLRTFLDGKLRIGLKRRLDAQLINGTGTGANLLGLANRTGIATYAPTTAEDRAVSIRSAMTVMEQLESVPEIIAFNPLDAQRFDLTHYATEGLHAVPNLVTGGSTRPWGLQAVRTNAIAAGTALLIDPVQALILDRMQPQAYMTDSHASNFTSNILTLLLELRAGLALFAGSGVCKITFNGTA